MQILLEHAWPGNVREIDHAIERAVLMAQGPLVTGRPRPRTSRDGGGRLEDMSLEEVECFLIKKAMTRFDGNVSQAAKALGLRPQRSLPAASKIWTLAGSWFKVQGSGAVQRWSKLLSVFLRALNPEP